MGNNAFHIRLRFFQQSSSISRAGQAWDAAVRRWAFVGALVSIVCCLMLHTPAFSQFAPARSVQYVLLDTDRVLSGTVLVQGTSVIVRRGTEAEVVLRAEQVVAVADSMPLLYEARSKAALRRSTSSTENRLADARWCIDQGLAAHATEALMNVYAVAPNHPIAMQLESRLRRLMEAAPAVHVGDAGTWSEHDLERNAAASNAIQPVSHEVAKFADESEMDVQINATTAPASLHAFTAKVQPILISRCARCHHQPASQTSNWNLVLPPAGAVRVTQRGSVANLQATIPFCDPRDPQNSKLMTQALSNHSGIESEKPPIAAHERSLAYTLAAWIASLGTAPSNSLQVDSVETQWNTPKEPLSPIEPSDVVSSLVSPSRVDISPQTTPQQSPTTTNRPVRLPLVENADSVEHFNRETMLRRKFGIR